MLIKIGRSRKPQRRSSVAHHNAGARPYSEQGQAQLKKVCKTNKEEYRTEKRVLELGKRGFNEGAVSGMMQISESSAKAMLRKKHKGILLDGAL